MSLDPVTNFAKATVSGTYDASDNIVDVSTGLGSLFPDPATDGDFNVTWYNATDYDEPSYDPDVEIVRVTGRTADQFTITRAQEGTLASVKDIAGKTYLFVLAITQKMIEDIGALQTTILAATGTVDDSNLDFTFTTEPLLIVINGASYRKGHGWSWSVGTATLDFPVGTGGDIYGLI